LKSEEKSTCQGEKYSKAHEGRSKPSDSPQPSVIFPVTEPLSKDNRKSKAEKSGSNPNHQMVSFPQNPMNPQSEFSGQKQGFTSFPNQNPPKFPCYLCGQNHWAIDCPVYVSFGNRINRVRQLNLCFRCLKAAHPADQCRAKKPCSSCQGLHHPVLCPSRVQKQASFNVFPENSRSNELY
jgi:hypothetical protein